VLASCTNEPFPVIFLGNLIPLLVSVRVLGYLHQRLQSDSAEDVSTGEEISHSYVTFIVNCEIQLLSTVAKHIGQLFAQDCAVVIIILYAHLLVHRRGDAEL
jgi:hypothetical protein